MFRGLIIRYICGILDVFCRGSPDYLGVARGSEEKGGGLSEGQETPSQQSP